MEQFYKKGYEIGYKKGYEKGRLKIVKNAVFNLIDIGLSVEQIADLGECDTETVKSWLNEDRECRSIEDDYLRSSKVNYGRLRESIDQLKQGHLLSNENGKI